MKASLFAKSARPAVMSASIASVIRSPLGMFGTYLLIGSSSETLRCSANCRISVPVKVFVTDAIRWYRSVVIGWPVAGSATP